MSDAQAAPILRRYVEGRGWRWEAVETFDLTVVLDSWGRPRIRHPYRSGGDVKWWQDRAAHPNISPRWMCPRGMRRWPYSADLLGAVDVGEGEAVVVVEGAADVISLWHVLGDGCHVVGLPGTAGVERFAPMFEGLPLVLALDADGSGDAASARLAGVVGGRTVRVRPPEGMDISEWRLDGGDEAVRAGLLDVLDRAGDMTVEGVS